MSPVIAGYAPQIARARNVLDCRRGEVRDIGGYRFGDRRKRRGRPGQHVTQLEQHL